MRLQFKIIRKKFYKILLSMIIIISLGVALLFGLMNGVSSLHNSVDKFIEENNYPDIKISTNIENIDKTEDLTKEGFKNVEYRLSISTIMEKGNDILSVKASTYENKDLKDFYIYKEKENTSDYYDILVEKRFADNNKIKLGDNLKIKIGEEYINFFVTKIISIPEAIVGSPINGMWGEINDFGNVYINRNVLKEKTKKKKQKYLDEVLKKEEEILTEEANRLEEYNNAKAAINTALNKYHEKELYYEEIKKELNNQKDELNSNKEKLLQLKSEYNKTTEDINDLKSLIYSYINFYDNLSDDAKDYINKLIESKYPTLKIEDLEFITDIAYSTLEYNINELFDQDNEINKKIQNKIAMADIIKILAELQYNSLNSDSVVNLVSRIKNGEDVTSLPEYMSLKSTLELYSIFGEVTDSNIVFVYESTKAVLNEIHKANQKLPFDSFSDFYNAIDSSRVLLPFLYNSVKEDLKPYFQKIVEINNSNKASIKNEVTNIYNSNKSAITKAKLITNKVFDYIQNTVDESVLSTLSEYTDDLSGGPLPTINRLLNKIDNGLNEINKDIDNPLNAVYKLINNKKAALDKAYNTFKAEIQKAKEQLNDKKSEIENIEGYENKFNEILICLYDKNNKDDVLKNVSDNYLNDIEILDSYTYERSPIHRHITVNIGSMEKLTSIVPIAFYTIILVVLFLFISLMIKQSKREIGILRLLGKTNNEIRLGFCISNLIVALLGIVLGIIIGLFPMVYMVEYFKEFFLLPSVIYSINGTSLLLCTVITILVVELASIIATKELDKITPVEVLKKEEYHNKEISKFTKFIISKFKPFKKFSIIVFIRNKSKLILGIICTSATVALIFSSLAYVASKNRIFSSYFDDRIHYDAQIFKNGTVTEKDIEDIRALDYVESADLLRYFNVTVKNNEKEVNIVINALDNKNNYTDIFDKNNNEIEYPENGIVLEAHIANDLGVNLNDEININGIPFKIVDISFQPLGRINYISLEDSYKLKSSFDTIVLKMNKNKKSELINKVSSKDNYIYTAFLDDIEQYNKKRFDSYTMPSIIIIIFTLIIGDIIIINLYLYNLLDQRRNLSIFRSLGFQYREISKNWFIQSIIQWTTSMIIGIPTGIMLSKFFLKTVSSDRREFIYASGIKEFIITAVLLFLYIYIGHIKCMKSFRKMNIIEEIKDRD